MSDSHPRRVDRLARLVGPDALPRLERAHVLVVGLGGVGSYCAEALARSGVGRLTLVDFDRVCETNINRQLHALVDTVDRTKAGVMRDRLERINPNATINPLALRYQPELAEAFLAAVGDKPDYVVDAIDTIAAKCHLIATCRNADLPIVAAMGAAGRLDPTRVRVADLAATETDPLAYRVRKLLRQRHGFPRRGPMGVPAVYSDEPAASPHPLHYDADDDPTFRFATEAEAAATEAERYQTNGSAVFVTGTFGFAAASVVVQALIAPHPPA